jgi:hypothetical protein
MDQHETRPFWHDKGTTRHNSKCVFGLAFKFSFCPIKAKSQTKGAEPGNNFFSKSRLSCSVKMKAPLDLLLAAFR